MNHSRHLTLVLLLLLATVSGMQAQSSFWRQLDRPYGGDVLLFVTGPNGDLLAGSEQQGVLRSTDNGVTWFSIHPDSIDMLPSLIARNGSIFGFGDGRGGAYRSTDNGATWQKIANGLDSVRTGFMTETATGTILMAAREGVYRTTNNGDLWTPSGLDSIEMRFAAINGSMVYLATQDSGLYRSSDDGITWGSIGNLHDHPIDAFVFIDSMTIVVGTDNGIFRSTDGGATFTPFGIPDARVNPLSMGRLSNGDIVVGTRDSGAYRISVDGGSVARLTDAPVDDLSALAVVAPDVILLGYEGSGIFRSTDGGVTFEQVGIAGGAQAESFAEGPNGEIYAGTRGGLSVTTDRGTTWRDLGLFEPVTHLAVTSSGTIFAAGRQGAAFRSTDNGSTWTTLDLNVGPDFSGLAITPAGTIIYTSNDGVERSTDNGATWTRTYDGNVYHIAMAPNGTLYSYGFMGLLRSIDDGVTWTEQELNGPIGTSFRVDGIATPSNNVLLLSGSLGSTPGVIRSTDQGTTWSISKTGCPEDFTMFVYEGPAETAFAVGTCGVFRTVDGGASWTLLAEVPEQNQYGSFLADSRGGVWYGARGGIYVGNQPSAVPAAPTAVTRGALSVLPNPSHGAATIGFTLAGRSHVTLTLVDMLGERVAIIADGSFAAGDHSLELARSIPAGSYLLQMKAGDTATSTIVRIVE